MRKSDVGDGGVEQFHEGGERDGDGDEPGVDGHAGSGQAKGRGWCESLAHGVSGRLDAQRTVRSHPFYAMIKEKTSWSHGSQREPSHDQGRTDPARNRPEGRAALQPKGLRRDFACELDESDGTAKRWDLPAFLWQGRIGARSLRLFVGAGGQRKAGRRRGSGGRGRPLEEDGGEFCGEADRAGAGRLSADEHGGRSGRRKRGPARAGSQGAKKLDVAAM